MREEQGPAQRRAVDADDEMWKGTLGRGEMWASVKEASGMACRRREWGGVMQGGGGERRGKKGWRLGRGMPSGLMTLLSLMLLLQETGLLPPSPPTPPLTSHFPPVPSPRRCGRIRMGG